MTIPAASPTQKSVQLSSISVTVRGQQKPKDLSVKVELSDVRIRKQKFKDKLLLKIQFNPPYSINITSTLTVRLCESHLFREEVLTRMEFTVDMAQGMLGLGTEAKDHLVFSDAVADFRLSFSMNSNSAEDLIRAGVEVADNLTSILDYLGENCKLINTLLSFGTAASELNPIAKAVLESVNEINKVLRAGDDCDKDIRDLVMEMADCLRCVADVRQFARSEELLNALEQIDPLLCDTANFISQYSSFSAAKKIISLSTSDKTRDELASLTRHFSSFKQRFDRGIAAQTGLTIEEMKRQLNLILEDSAFRAESAILRTLKPTISEIRHGQEGCMEGTRVDILNAIDEWIDDPNGPTIFWLRGHPGTGKSAIAASVRARLLRTRQLGSSFFFQRQDFASQSPAALWCSVAHDIAQKSTTIRRAVVDELKQEIVPSQSSPAEIFDKLIAGPLTLPPDEISGRALVIVIDALDECGGLQRSQIDQKEVLMALNRCKSLPLKVKIFVTSRNEGNIESVLGLGGPRCKVLEVGESATLNSSLDIKRYLKQGFDEILDEFTTIERPWPTDSDLQLLADTAAGLFIWASTVLNLVRDGNPQRELAAVLAMIRSRGSHMSQNMDLLGHLYDTLLTSKFKTQDQISRFVKVAGAVIAAQIPLSSEDLVELLSASKSNAGNPEELDRTDVETICRKLKSVLATGSGLRFLHQSFADFLISLPSDSQFHCDKGIHEERLALACLETMDQKLHFNMGNVETSYIFNQHIPGLLEKIAPEVYYSCRFWATHLQNVENGGILLPQVENFLHSQFFFWLEVLSIREEVGSAPGSLESLLTWKSLEENSELRKVTGDALVFVHSYATLIALSVPHIYLSAFPFAPRGSLIKRLYSEKIPGVVKIKTGDDVTWHPLQAVWHGHRSCVTSVAVSHDSKRVVSGSDDCTARIWDLKNNQHIGTIIGHKGTVATVAFSGDDRHIVSGSSDCTLRLWDSQNFQQIGPVLMGHTNGVFSVAFSPDSRRLVSSAADFTVRIWDLETYQQLGECQGHTDLVKSVGYSPDGARIVSGSHDCSVRIWDAHTYQQLGETLIGHSHYIVSVSFCPSGTRIASGSQDGTVCLWDAATYKQIGVPFIGHTAAVTSIAFSYDGNLIASGSNDRTVRIWDTESQTQIGEPLDEHEYFVRSVAFSGDGEYIISAGNDNTVRIWNVQIQQHSVGSPTGHVDCVNCVRISPNNRYIFSASGDQLIRVWNAETWQETREPLAGHLASVYCIAFSHDGNRLVSGSADCTIRIWDVETRQQIGTLSGHERWITSIAFSPDDRHIVSASGDLTVRIWDVETQSQAAELATGRTWHRRPVLRCQNANITSVIFSRDGDWVLSGSDDHTVQIWDMETYRQVGSLVGHTGVVMAVTVSPGDKHFVSGARDSTIRIWSSQTYEQVGGSLIGHTDGVLSVDSSPDGARIVSGSGDQTIRIWDFHTHQQLGECLTGHTDRVRSVAYSADGKRIVSGSDDCSVRIWDAETHMQIGNALTGHTNYVRSVAFSPNSSIASGSYDGTVRIWDAENGKQIGVPINGHTNAVTSVAFSSDGTRLASGSWDTTIMIWDAATHEQIGETLRGHISSVRLLAFSPDGSHIASGGDDWTVRIWNTGPQRPVRNSPTGHTDWVACVGYSPNGKYIITASEDQTLLLWDANTYQRIGKPLTGHTNGVLCVSFSYDGNLVVSGSSDSTIRIWDVETQAQIGETIAGHSISVSSVAFSPDNKRIVSGSWDRTVRLWDVATHRQIGNTFTGHTDGVNSVTFSHNGKHVISGSEDRTVRFWDAEIQHTSPRLHQGPIKGLLESGRNYLSPTLTIRGEWLVGPNNEPLLWIPDHLRPRVPFFPLLSILGGEPMIQFDTSDFHHGEHWTRCWNDQ